MQAGRVLFADPFRSTCDGHAFIGAIKRRMLAQLMHTRQASAAACD